jgi:hypothetical protein
VTGKKKLSTPCWKAQNLLYLSKRPQRCCCLAGAVPVVGKNTKRRGGAQCSSASDCIAASFPFLCGGLVPEIQRHCCFNGNASFFGNNRIGGFL